MHEWLFEKQLEIGGLKLCVGNGNCLEVSPLHLSQVEEHGIGQRFPDQVRSSPS